MANLLAFFERNKLTAFEDIQRVLQAPPYNLKVKDDGPLYIINYDQIRTRFSHKLCSEARGIILEKESNRIVCYPFDKFWNYSKHNGGKGGKIDWDTAAVQEKVDGSLMKLYFYDESWRVATNGCIDARKAAVYNAQRAQCSACSVAVAVSAKPGGQETAAEEKAKEEEQGAMTYHDLFMRAGGNLIDFEALDTSLTYMFEVVSPLNRVVVPYKEEAVVHIGTRSIHAALAFRELANVALPLRGQVCKTATDSREERTGSPARTAGQVRTPVLLGISSLQEAVAAASKGSFKDGEGFVVCDASFRRVKIKCPSYVSAHHIQSRLNQEENTIGLVLSGEVEELLLYTAPDAVEALRLLADGWRDRLQRLAEEVVQVQLSMLESLQVTSGVKWGDEQVDEVGRHYGLAASKVGSPVVKKLLFVLKSRWLALLEAGREEAQEAGELEGAELRMMEATMRGNAWAALKDIDAKQLIKALGSLAPPKAIGSNRPTNNKNMQATSTFKSHAQSNSAASAGGELEARAKLSGLSVKELRQVARERGLGGKQNTKQKLLQLLLTAD